jgi:hypothetical protein
MGTKAATTRAYEYGPVRAGTLGAHIAVPVKI